MKGTIEINYIKNGKVAIRHTSLIFDNDDIEKIKNGKELPQKYFISFMDKEVNEDSIVEIIVYLGNDKIYFDDLFDRGEKVKGNPQDAIIEQEYEMMEEMTEGQLAEYLAENFNDFE